MHIGICAIRFWLQRSFLLSEKNMVSYKLKSEKEKIKSAKENNNFLSILLMFCYWFSFAKANKKPEYKLSKVERNNIIEP